MSSSALSTGRTLLPSVVGIGTSRPRWMSVWSIASLLALGACGGTPTESAIDSVSQADGLSHGHHEQGEVLFQTPFAGTNGRSCASCHVLDDHTVLTPAHVTTLLAENPTDPLFNRIDADDPNAEVPTYEHLKKGLVRVTIKLPDNMDLIDSNGNVVTGPDRTYSVWRAVPTTENAAITAPYQYDGRKGTLQQQAQGAISSHSQGPIVSSRDLDFIAAFQKTEFTSKRARKVAQAMAHGTPVDQIPRPELEMDLTDAQARGLTVYNAACEACHGGATTLQVTNRDVHRLAFLKLKADGNVLYNTAVTPPAPVPQDPSPDDEFLNVGFGNISYLGQLFNMIGFGDLFGPRFNKDVALPQYRYRFYTDATRTVKNVDLPPIPVTATGQLFDLQAQQDENGAPIVGPNLLPQWWSTDPGRAGITGDPRDFEAFDVPALRGIANSAPYFHDNSAETLKDAVDLYSRFILPFFTMLNLPATLPPEEGSFFPESLSPQQKADLLEFLQVL
jgi:cytochrome c peroxidase